MKPISLLIISMIFITDITGNISMTQTNLLMQICNLHFLNQGFVAPINLH